MNKVKTSSRTKNSDHPKRDQNVGSIDPVTYDSSTVSGLIDEQQSLIAELFQAVAGLEEALQPILNGGPGMFKDTRVQTVENPSISLVVDDLARRNQSLRSLYSDVIAIRNALTL